VKVPRVELHRRWHMCNMAFVLCARKRICLPRAYFIRFSHTAAVTGWHAAEKPGQFRSTPSR
jgi:hypothetical protein